MPLGFLCLHSWGTNIKILQSQLNGLMSDLKKDNTAEFYPIEGDLDSEPGPGIEGFYEGPFYSYYKFPRSFDDGDNSIWMLTICSKKLSSKKDRVTDCLDFPRRDFGKWLLDASCKDSTFRTIASAVRCIP